MLGSLKRFFGWGESEVQEQEAGAQSPQPQRQQQQRKRQEGKGKTSGSQSSARRREAPLIQEAAGSGGGVQGLSWYCTDLRRDSDGDLAHGFYEEPEGPPKHGGKKDGKKGKKPPTNCCNSRAQPAGPGSVVLVTGGNVTVAQREG